MLLDIFCAHFQEDDPAKDSPHDGNRKRRAPEELGSADPNTVKQNNALHGSGSKRKAAKPRRSNRGMKENGHNTPSASNQSNLGGEGYEAEEVGGAAAAAMAIASAAAASPGTNLHLQ